jgi:hypothetical protein
MMGNCIFNPGANRCAAVALFWVALGAGPALAGSTAVAVPAADSSRGLQLIDWRMIGLYAVMTICLGVYYGRKQESGRQ